MTPATKTILLIQGHPDQRQDHLCHALANAYRDGALAAGHTVELVTPATLDFPFIRNQEDFDHSSLPDDLVGCKEGLERADHIVLIYPLWLGTLPAYLKAFLEQLLRPGIAMEMGDDDSMPKQLLRGKSARIIVTMGMPAIVYRWFFGAHSLKSLRHNILALCGVRPIKSTTIGMVQGQQDKFYTNWFKEMERLGKSAL